VSEGVRQEHGGSTPSLVHDYLLVLRGAERTFAAIADLYPAAPIFTLLYDERGTSGRFADREIHTSPLQRLGARQATFRRLLPLYPWAIERLELPPSDIVISSSSAFAHGVRAPRGALHVCYCHAPFRYAWYEQDRALAEAPAALRPLLRAQLRRLRRWDVEASGRVDVYVANSQLTRERIKHFYGREAEVVHPPVETHRFAPGEAGGSLLVVSELVRHKQVHVALEAARRAGAPIRVVGAGPDLASLQAAHPEAEFMGRVGDAELAAMYASARALVMPSTEEFGIVAVEAQAAGRPVLAAAAGGALETVLDGRTGCLLEPGSVDAFQHAIEALDALDFDPLQAVRNAERFSVPAFQRRLGELVGRALPGSSAAPAGARVQG
jgi:glycosyltransferase involved in cell wall biosynthesis